MARASSTKTGVSKVRLVVFEAEVSDGDLSQFTHAIQNALLPRQSSAVRVISAQPKAISGNTDDFVETEDVDYTEQDVVETPKPKPRASKLRSIKPPKVVDGIDWDTDQSLKSFAECFELKTTFERYLVVALWFKDHREVSAIGAPHVYTAFRHLGWSTSIPDFDKPFRNMRDNQLFTGGTKEGFSINQLGEGKIKAKKRDI